MASDWQVEQRKRMLAAIMLLALLAVADGVWLTHLHVNLTVGKPGVGQVCHALSKDGCSVTAGEYGALFGVPVSVIGTAGALSTFVVALVAFRRRAESFEPFRVATFVLAMVSVAASVVMGSLSAMADSFCPFCVGWYGLNLAMGVCSWLAVEASDRNPATALRKATGAPLLPMVATFSLTLAAGIFAESRYLGSLLEERDAFLRAQVEALKASGQTELPLDRMQTHGPEDAEVVIVEVADFQCPFCRKLWRAVDGYKAKSGRKVRTAFVHYPLDNKCNPRLEHGAHEFACESAIASECAGKEGKFFEYGALLFDNQPKLGHEDLLGYAEQLGLDRGAFEACLADPKSKAAVRKSIELARELKVRATPTFFVNGYKFEGARSEQMLEAIVESLLSDNTAD